MNKSLPIKQLLITAFISIISLLAFASPSWAVGEQEGVWIGAQWLGSYDTLAPEGYRNAYCIDSGRDYPRQSYAWSYAGDTAPDLAYLLHKYQNETNNNRAAALAYITHHSTEVPHNDEIPAARPGAEILSIVSDLRAEAQRFSGPYTATVNIPTSVSPGQTYTGTLRIKAASGYILPAGQIPGGSVSITLQNAVFYGTSLTTKSFASLNFNFKIKVLDAPPLTNASLVRATADTNNILPSTGVRRWDTNDWGPAQRVVSHAPGLDTQDADQANVDFELLAQGAVGVFKTDATDSSRLQGALIGVYQGAALIDTQFTDENGEAIFTENIQPNTLYNFKELAAPPGYRLSASNPSVTSGATVDDIVFAQLAIADERKQFDLALRKFIYAVNSVPTGQTGAEGAVEPTQVRMGDVVTHRLLITNQNEVPGRAAVIADYVPLGYDFDQSLNPGWVYDVNTRVATTQALSESTIPADPTPGGDHADDPGLLIDLNLRVNANLFTQEDGLAAGTNYAEICDDHNDFDYPDIDSTPDCNIINDLVGGDNIIDNTNRDEDDHDYDQVVGVLSAHTNATDYARLSSPIADTATIDGLAPAGLILTFRLYTDNVCQTEPVFVSDQIILAADQTQYPIEFTPAEVGTYYWVAEITNAYGKNYFMGICADKAEISQVWDVTTQAINRGSVGSKAHDVATVSGSVPPGSVIYFRLYGPNDKTNCTSTPIFVDDPQPIVEGVSEYTSADYTIKEPGRYWWSEIVEDANGNVLAAGKCKVEAETTSAWSVTTKALSGVLLGEEIQDVAYTEGVFPEGATIHFTLYDNAKCSKKPLFVSKKQKLDPGVITYLSELYAPKEVGAYYWVEVVEDQDGKEIGRGVCGVENETSLVIKESPPPTTTTSSNPPSVTG